MSICVNLRLPLLLCLAASRLAPAREAETWGAWHPPVSTTATVEVTAGGEVTIAVTHDVLAFAAGRTSEMMSTAECYLMLGGPEEELAAAFDDGRARFAGEFQILADGVPLPFEISEAPTVEAVRAWKAADVAQTLPCAMDFVVKAQLPTRGGPAAAEGGSEAGGAGSPDDAARSISLHFPRVFDKTILIVHRPGVKPRTIPLGIGEPSPAIDVRAATGSLAPPSEDDLGAFEVAWRYIKLGFTHIIPEGVDHCLFVLGLFLLSPRFKPVLGQITAFTLAHTVTLTLTSLDIVGLPMSIVEPAIAASIAFVAIENLLTKKVNRRRYAVAFIFGLIHGMGVATIFKEAGFPTGQLVNSLASFTVGVEAGHVTVLAAAFLTLGWWREKKWYRARIAIPLSLVIALIALWWVVQRLSGAD